MKNWYATSKDIKLIDGTKVREYKVVFETTELDLRNEVIEYLQKIMDRDKESEKQ